MKLGMFRFNIVVYLKIFKIFNVFLFYYLIFVLDLDVFINKKNLNIVVLNCKIMMMRVGCRYIFLF